MEKGEKFQRVKTGKPEYLNENCWLVKTLNYTPYKRCQHCELKFRNCLFLHYQIVSLILILFLFALSFLIEGKISELIIISVFTLVIVYGYFFNKSTDKIIKANFAQRKAKEALEELTQNLQQKVDEQTKDIRALSEIKSEFLKIVNHQLRTPTSIIKGMLSMLVDGSIKGEEAKEYLDKIYNSAERLETILDDLLTAQDLVGAKPILNPSLYNLEKLISEIIKRFSISAQRKNLFIVFDKQKEPLPQIFLDKSIIEKVLRKLIDNAILYTEKGGITIGTHLIREDEKDFVQITVKDSGIGIVEEDKERLFKIFSRGKEAEKIHPNGSGLGLYIVSEYVKVHQGKIDVKSEGKNKGTTFKISLPIISEI